MQRNECQNDIERSFDQHFHQRPWVRICQDSEDVAESANRTTICSNGSMKARPVSKRFI